MGDTYDLRIADKGEKRMPGEPLRDSIETSDKREAILQSAKEVFAIYGFKKANIEDIASKLGLTKGAVYHYFKNKEDIFSAVVEHEGKTILTNIRNATKGIDDPEKKLNAYMKARFDQLQEHNHLLNASKKVIFEILPLVDEKWNDYLADEARILQNILQEGVELGVFDTPDTEAVAQIIQSAIEGTFAKIFLHDSKEKAFESLSTVIWVILNGIKKR